MKAILLVEDHDSVRAAISEFLSSKGFEVCEAENGQVALDKLNQGFMPDLILTDLRMPVKTGPEMLKALRSIVKFATIPIIVMSSNLGELPGDIMVQGRLSKPVEFEELIQTIQRVI